MAGKKKIDNEKAVLEENKDLIISSKKPTKKADTKSTIGSKDSKTKVITKAGTEQKAKTGIENKKEEISAKVKVEVKAETKSKTNEKSKIESKTKTLDSPKALLEKLQGVKKEIKKADGVQAKEKIAATKAKVDSKKNEEKPKDFKEIEQFLEKQDKEIEKKTRKSKKTPIEDGGDG